MKVAIKTRAMPNGRKSLETLLVRSYDVFNKPIDYICGTTMT